jgi:tetratricopeptide (TPR) repeat protein
MIGPHHSLFITKFMHSRKKQILQITSFVLGWALFASGIYYKWGYMDLIKKGNQAIQENRLDTQDYEVAGRSLLASKDVIHYNLGVQAYKAENFNRAVNYFRQVIQESSSDSLKARAYYNLGNILTLMEQPKEAVTMYQAALRLDPSDWETKYNLERLYVFNPKALGEGNQEASMEQEPQGNPNDTPDPAKGKGWVASPETKGI